MRKQAGCRTESYLHGVYNKIPHAAFKGRNIPEWGGLKFRRNAPDKELFHLNRLFCCQVLHMSSVFIDLDSEDADRTFDGNR